MDLKHFSDLHSHFEHWIETALWLLEDHGYPISPHQDHFAFIQLEKILLFKEDLSINDLARLVYQLQDRKRCHALPAARFSH